jgi:type III secretion protein Q
MTSTVMPLAKAPTAPSTPGSPLHERLCALGAWQAQASRLLFDVRLKHLLPVGYLASAAWINPRDLRAADDEGAWVTVRFEGAAGSVDVIVAGGLGGVLAQALDPSLPLLVQTHLLQVAMKEASRWLESVGMSDVRATAVQQAVQPGAANASQIELRWTAGSQRSGKLRLLALDALALQSVRTRVAQKTLSVVKYRGLGLPGRFVFGHRSLPVQRADALRAGDVLLPQSPLSGSDDIHGDVHFGAVSGRRCVAQATCCDALITIKGKPTMSSKSDQPKSGAALGEHPVRLEELDVPINFEIETSSLTLAELEGMEPGYVFELPMPARAATVRLTVYGQVIGLGELVSVGDQLGVRILRIGTSNAVGTSH